MMRRSLGIGLRICLVAASATSISCLPNKDDGKKGENTEKTIAVSVGAIEVRTVERLREVVGNLKGWDELTLGAKRGGRISKVRHDMGDRVKPGELMIELEPVDADLAVEQSKRRLDADLAKIGLKAMPDRGFDIDKVPTVVQARVSLDRARLNLGRERALVGKGSGTVQDYQNAENDEQAALAAYDAARLTAESSLASALASKVALDVAEQARRDLVTITPEPSKILPGLTKDVSFAVTRRAVSEGQMVREGDALFDLVIENPLRLWCNVPEVYASEIRLGQDVRVAVLSHPGRIFGGKVSRINPSVDPVSRTFQVEAAVPNDDGALRPGGFAKVGIVTAASSEAITVPRAALVEFAGVTKLYLIDENKRARSIPVERGIEGDRWVEVIGEVPRTGNVAIDGASSLAEGTLVTVIQPLDESRESEGATAAPKSSTAPAAESR